MPVNSTHAEYDASLPGWERARDLLAGEDAVKAAGVKYLPRLDAQTDEEYLAYQSRACFFNACRRAADAFVGLVFRKAPFVKLPDGQDGIGKAMTRFSNDADMLGTSLFGYAKNVVREVVSVGRAGTLVDWEGDFEQRAYASAYHAEDIINWRVERVNGRNVPTMIVLREWVSPGVGAGADEFSSETVEQHRVMKLEEVRSQEPGGKSAYQCVVEIWRPKESKGKDASATAPNQKPEFELVDIRMPLRLGKPLPLIPFIFHGSCHSRPEVGWMPLADMLVLNLDHYRLDADYKHGLHFTALPTAWVAGFDKTSTLTIGSKAAWVFEHPQATAGFLEFRGDGLGSFERALERDDRVMAVLGSQILENQNRVAETATAIMLRQAGENSVLANLATSVSESLTQVLRWVYWWNSTESIPELVTDGQVLVELNTDFGTSGMQSGELASLVKAWKDSAISQDTMLEQLRKREILPEGRSNRDEVALIAAGKVTADAGAGMGQEGATPPLKIV